MKGPLNSLIVFSFHHDSNLVVVFSIWFISTIKFWVELASSASVSVSLIDSAEVDVAVVDVVVVVVDVAEVEFDVSLRPPAFSVIKAKRAWAHLVTILSNFFLL